MHILWTLIIGLVTGAIAKLVMPGKDPGGIIVTMLLGVAGAFVANWIGHEFIGTAQAKDPGSSCRSSVPSFCSGFIDS